MKDNKDFSVSSEPTWYIYEPGVLCWENTQFSIQLEFVGPPIYYVLHKNNKVGVGFTLNTAKEVAKSIANEMIEMGLEI
jgi:hypothetical protein